MEIYVDFSKKISDEKVSLVKRKYDDPAVGWKNGYYHQRQPKEKVLDKSNVECDENGLLITSNNWKEKGGILGHDTGSAGVFEYNETTEVKLRVDNANYKVDYRLVNPCLTDHSLDVYVNDIYEKTVLISGKSSISDSFISAICVDHLTISFADHNWATKRKEAKNESFYLKDICVKRQPLLEKRTKPRIFIISDSTAQTYNELQSPQAGWGQCLPAYFKSQTPVIQKDIQAGYPQAKGYRLSSIDIDNWSIGARSTKSFIEEGKFKVLLQRVHSGDIALIQWATNDASASRPNRFVTPEQFGVYLKEYVNSISVRGALPILITPPARLLLDQDSRCYPLSFPEYREQYLKVAQESNCLLIDLDQKSADLFNSFGPQKASINFMQLAPYNYGNFSEGIVDATHFQHYGADQLAHIISQNIYEMLPQVRSLMYTTKLTDRDPEEPEKLNGLVLEEHQDQKYVYLQWQRTVNAEYYLIKRRDEKGNDAVVGTTMLTNYSDLTIQENGRYQYWVVPCNQEIEGEGENLEIEYHCADGIPNLKAPNLFEIDNSLDKDKIYFSLRFNGMPNIVEYNICYQSQTTAELNGILENIQQVDVLRLHSYFLPLGKYNIWIKAQMEDGSFIVSPKVEL